MEILDYVAVDDAGVIINPLLASVVSHAKLYKMIWTCYAVWHVGKQHSAGDNG